jgi:hypothetical protein
VARDLLPVFEALRAILKHHESSFNRVTDEPGKFSLEREFIKERWVVGFGAVILKRGKVSFDLNALEYAPFEVEASISERLLEHRTKAKFFNFTALDEPLFAELKILVERALETWRPEYVLWR